MKLYLFYLEDWGKPRFHVWAYDMEAAARVFAVHYEAVLERERASEE